MTVPASAPRVAVIGCGAWGRNHVRTYAALGALGAVCDASTEAVCAAAEAAGVPARPVEDVLTDTAIDGVVIAAPDALHAKIAAQALAAGKHVLVEKPMAMTVADAEQIAKTARRDGRVLMVGHILRYHAAFQALEALVRDGRLGTVRHLESKRLHVAGGAPRHVLWDLAPHDVSMMLALAGRLPETVRAFAAAEIAEGRPQTATLALDFGGGLTGGITLSDIHPVKLHQIVVAGTVAQAVFEDSRGWDEKLALYRPGLGAAGQAPAREALPLRPGEPLADEARAFLAAIAGGPAPVTDAAEGLWVVRVLAAAARAIATGAAERP